MKFNLAPHQMPSSLLYHFFGRFNLNKEQQAELIKTVGMINAIDDKVSENFFLKNSRLSLAERNDFKTIEKVADLVDRSQDPVAEQEFGRKLLPAHQYIQDKTLKFYAKYLEKEYNQIIKQNYLPAVGTCRRLFFHF